MWALLLLLLPARAEVGGLDAHGFTPAGHAGTAGGFLEVDTPVAGWPGAWDAGVIFDYSDDPLVEMVGDRAVPVLDQVLAANVVAGASILGACRVDLTMPVYALAYDQIGGFAALGDLRLSTTVPVLRQRGRSLGVGIVPSVSAPTGVEERYLGEQGFGLGATLALAETLGDFSWALNLGGRVGPREEVRNVVWGSGLVGGAGVSWALHDQASLAAEIHATPTQGVEEAQLPAEALVHGRVRLPMGLWALLGGGAGVSGGVGASRFRVVLGLGWSALGTRPVEDKDTDGLDDKRDRCPTAAEDVDGFEDLDGCPDLDHDADGVPNTEDACVEVPEDPDGVQDTDGCPELDADQDRVADGSDKCPLEAEDLDGNADLDGCPEDDPDYDGDGVPDFRDVCPEHPIRAGQNPRTSNGCPKLAEISEDKIVITDRIYFEEGKARLLPTSFPVLEAVSQVLREHPEIADLLVEGHTNDVGDDQYNYRLSDDRARAVVAWLVQQGIDQNRLAAKGYGETRPLAPNDSDANRAANRRVEFTIVKRVR